MKPRKFLLHGLLLAASVLASAPALAVVVTTFGPNGEAGYIFKVDPDGEERRILSIGASGDVNELDAFLNLGGGTTLLLSDGGLGSAGVGFAFGYGISADGTDLTLSYTFTNNTGGLLPDVRFFSFLDAEIGETANSPFYEFGEVVGSGGDPSEEDADLFEIDEPGYDFGDIYDNLLAGTLDGTNSLPLGSLEDVSMALGFFLGPIDPGGSVSIRILLSEDFDTLGSLSLVQRDRDSLDTVITMSGRVVSTAVSEPGTLALLTTLGLLGILGKRRRDR
jgi:hypothetical protein